VVFKRKNEEITVEGMTFRQKNRNIFWSREDVNLYFLLIFHMRKGE
jgi:hypothetical protein